MKIRINLKIFIFALIFLITKQIKIYGILMLFAFIHELAHCFVGLLVGFKPRNINIMPYGISIDFEVKCTDYNVKINKGTRLTLKKMIIAMAGPIMNAIIVFIYIANNISFFGIERQLVIYSNILIGIFNLIPIYPLDGGRIIKGFLHMTCGLKKSNTYTKEISKLTICILTAISSILILYIKNIAFIIIIIYLWYLVINEEKKSRLLDRILLDI